MLPETDVWLPDIRIVGNKPAGSSSDSKDQPQDVKVEANNSPPKYQGAFPYPFPNMYCRKADERLAEDRIGEELAPDATIWELYQEESREYDNELIDSRNKNLDMMLLFAGLFSAVVTGFLVETKSMLLQNPADVSVELLLYIARSQQRLEEGIARPGSPTIEIPPFEAPTCARLVNGFWYTSLSLALFAALLAMLAKEWLTAFGASRPRSPYAHTLLHQRRLKGLSQWYALHIIDFLPTVLHFALLLFAVGLVIYLWTIDYTIAMTIVVIVGVAVMFYAGTAVLASVYPFCPFVTQVSNQIFSAPIRANTKTEATMTSLEVLQALKWLTENARDQLAADCSYQALAGMKISQFGAKDNPLDHDSSAVHDDLSQSKVTALTTSKCQYDLFAEMFQTICSRIPQTLLSESGQLSASQGISISRYANALPDLLQLLERGLADLSTRKNNQPEALSQTWVQEARAQSALAALDFVWSDDRPYYTADTFALLTAAELRLTEVAASYCFEQPSPAAVMLSAPHVDAGDASISTKSWSVVDVIEITAEKISLFELRARFSRALFHAAVGLKYHADGATRLRTDALVYLLKSIHRSFLCHELNPRTPMSTHQPQSARDAVLPMLRSSVASTATNISLSPFNIGDRDGLLTSLMRIICTEATGEQPEVARSATHAFSVAASVLLRQWLTMNLDMNSSPAERSHINVALSDLQTFWPKSPSIDSDPTHTCERTMEQLLVVALIATCCSEYKGISQLSEQALRTLCQLTNGTFGPNYARIAALKSSDLILKLLPAMCSEKEKLDSQALKYLIRWLLTSENPENVTVIQRVREHTVQVHEKDIYVEFLDIWAHTPGLDSELSCLLEKIIEGPMGNEIHSLWSSSGLSVLVKIGLRTEYAPTLARLVVHMVSAFIGEDCGVRYWEDPIRRPALPHFLHVVGLALNNTPSSSVEYFKLSKAFLCAASALRCHMQNNLCDKGFDSYKNTFEMISNALLNRIAESPQRDALLSGYQELLDIADDSEAWMYEALSWVFKEDNVLPADGDREVERRVQYPNHQCCIWKG